LAFGPPSFPTGKWEPQVTAPSSNAFKSCYFLPRLSFSGVRPLFFPLFGHVTLLFATPSPVTQDFLGPGKISLISAILTREHPFSRPPWCVFCWQIRPLQRFFRFFTFVCPHVSKNRRSLFLRTFEPLFPRTFFVICSVSGMTFFCSS